MTSIPCTLRDDILWTRQLATILREVPEIMGVAITDDRRRALRRVADAALDALLASGQGSDHGTGLIGQVASPLAETEPSPNSTTFLDWIDLEALRQLMRPRASLTNLPLEDEYWWKEWRALRARIESQVGNSSPKCSSCGKATTMSQLLQYGACCDCSEDAPKRIQETK